MRVRVVVLLLLLLVLAAAGACVFDAQPGDPAQPPPIGCTSDDDCPSGWRCELVRVSDPTSCDAGDACIRESGRCLAPQTVRPQAQALDVTTDEDTPVAFTFASRDAGAGATFAVRAQAANGTLTFDEVVGSATYTPAADFNGIDTITYVVVSGDTESDPQVVTIDVAPVNDAPTAPPVIESLALDEDGVGAAVLDAIDVDADALQWSLVTDGAHGTCDVDDRGLLTFQPVDNFHGDDACTVRASDGAGSVDFVVPVLVSSINDAPRVDATTLKVAEDGVVIVPLDAIATDADGDALLVTVTDDEDDVVIYAGIAAPFSYAPPADFNGTRTFHIHAVDPADGTADGSLKIDVASIVDPPTVTDCSFDVNEDDGGGVEFALPVVSVPGEVLRFTLLSTPDLGTIAAFDEATGRGRYVPRTDAHGDDVIAFVASSAGIASAPATMTIHIGAIDDAPVLNLPATSRVDEDGVLQLDATRLVVDVDDAFAALALSVEVAPGVASIVGGVLHYAPPPDFHGTAVLSVTASDPAGATARATTTIDVASVFDVPVVAPTNLATNEDTAATIELLAASPDGAVTWVLDAAPAHGDVTLDAARGTLRYVPAADYSGDDRVVVHASLAGVSSLPAAIPVVVQARDDAPRATAIAVQLREDDPTTLSLLELAFDVDGDLLHIVAASCSSGDAIVDTDGTSLTLVPPADGNGSALLSVDVDDGHTVATLVYPVTIAPLPDPPRVADATSTTDEDTVVEIPLSVSSVDVTSFVYLVSAPPAHGSVAVRDTGSGPSARYVPSPDFHGADTFRFAVLASGSLVEANVDVTVRPTNDAPRVTLPASLEVAEDGTLELPIAEIVTDVDGDELTITPVAAPGTVAVIDGVLRYTPPPDFHDVPGASALLTVAVSDPDGLGDSVTRRVRVTSVDDVPVLLPATLTLNEDAVGATLLTANSPDGAPRFVLDTPPQHGTATLNEQSGRLEYTPAPDFHGDDRVFVKLELGNLAATPARVAIIVTPQNDAPAATSSSIAMQEDEPVTIGWDQIVDDVDGDPFVIATATASGLDIEVDKAARTLKFLPRPNDNGPRTLKLEVDDGTTVAALSYTLDLAPIDDPPFAADVVRSTSEDTAVDVPLVATSPDGVIPQLAVVKFPLHGSVTIEQAVGVPVARYVPDPDFAGDDSFDFRAFASGLTDDATVSIHVGAVNDPPQIALPLQVAIDEDAAFSATLGTLITDVDDALDSLTVTAAAASGTTVVDTAIVDGRLTVTPPADFNGSVVLVVTVHDPSGPTQTATCNITVRPIADAPVITTTSFDVVEDKAVTQVIAVNSPDGPVAFSVASATALGATVAIDSTTGALSYTPAQNRCGDDTVVVTAARGALSSTRAIRAAIQCVNDGAFAVTTGFNLVQGQQSLIPLSTLFIDVDTSPLVSASFTLANGTSAGTVSLQTPQDGGGGGFQQLAVGGGNLPDTTTGLGACDAEECLTITPRSDVNFANSGLAKVTLTLRDALGALPYAVLQYDVFVSGLSAAVATTNEDAPLTLQLETATPANVTATLAVKSMTLPTLGTASIVGSTLTFTPSQDATGTQDIVVRMTAAGIDVSSKVTVTITPVNDPPRAVGKTVTLAEDVPTVFEVSAIDPDSTVLFRASRLAGQSALGSLVDIGAGATTNTRRFQYTPIANRNGVDIFTLGVRDNPDPAAVDSDSELLILVVTPAPDLPTASGVSESGTEDVASLVFFDGADVDGDALTFSLNGGAILSPTPNDGAKATVTVNASRGAAVVTTPPNFNGTATIPYRVCDGTFVSPGVQRCASATAVVTVAPVNDPPVVIAPTRDLYIGTIDANASLPVVVTNDLTAVAQPDRVVVIDVDGPPPSAVTLTTTDTFGRFGGRVEAGRYLAPDPIQSLRDVLPVVASDGAATSLPVNVGVRFLDRRSCATLLNTMPAVVCVDDGQCADVVRGATCDRAESAEVGACVLRDGVYDLDTGRTRLRDGLLPGDEAAEFNESWSAHAACRMNEPGLRGFTRLAALGSDVNFEDTRWTDPGVLDEEGAPGERFDVTRMPPLAGFFRPWARQRTGDVMFEDVKSLSAEGGSPVRRALIELAPLVVGSTTSPLTRDSLRRLVDVADGPHGAHVAAGTTGEWLNLVQPSAFTTSDALACEVSGAGVAFGGRRARFGVVARAAGKPDEKIDCNATEPDRFVGVGLDAAALGGTAHGGAPLPTPLGEVMIWGRDRDFRLQGPRASCIAHADNGATLPGLYLVDVAAGKVENRICTSAADARFTD